MGYVLPLCCPSSHCATKTSCMRAHALSWAYTTGSCSPSSFWRGVVSPLRALVCMGLQYSSCRRTFRPAQFCNLARTHRGRLTCACRRRFKSPLRLHSRQRYAHVSMPWPCPGYQFLTASIVVAPPSACASESLSSLMLFQHTNSCRCYNCISRVVLAFEHLWRAGALIIYILVRASSASI